MPPSPGPLAADASLHLLVDHLIDALRRGEIEPCLLHVAEPGSEGFDLGMKPLGDFHPTVHLLGFDAPAEWHALGLATVGWAYQVDERSERRRSRRRVHVVTLLSRTGEVAHRVRVEGDAEISRRLGAELPVGEQIDLLHRALGMPTDPPPVDASAYWAMQWLTSLLDPSRPVPTTWHEVVRQHPAFVVLRNAGEHLDDDELDVLRAFQRVCGWSTMRTVAAEGRFPLPDLEPADARWLDDGAFARFLLNRCPPLASLRTEVADRLPIALAGRVFETLDDLGIPDVAWPDDVGRPSPAA